MFQEGLPDATGVYRYIKMMEGKGLVLSREISDENGKVKRMYSITDEGRACLKNWKMTLKSYQKSIGELIGMIGEEV